MTEALAIYGWALSTVLLWNAIRRSIGNRPPERLRYPLEVWTVTDREGRTWIVHGGP